MSQQHEFAANAQEGAELSSQESLQESIELSLPGGVEFSLPESAEAYAGVAPAQNVTTSVYQEAQKISVPFDSRFIAALLSKALLLLLAGLNLVIARQSIPLLFFEYITREEGLLLLLLGLFPLALTAVLGALVYWLNLLVGRRYNASVSSDGKLTLSKPFSFFQRLALEFFSLTTFICLLLDVYIYWHYSSLYSYNFGLTGLLLAFCSTLTATVLCGLALLVSWLAYWRRR